jgi:reverse transcriptase-like protein
MEEDIIEECNSHFVEGKVFYSKIFTLPKKHSNKRRVTVNLKPLNTFIPCAHFKMEGHRTVQELLRPGDHLCKLDISQAYLLIPVQQHFRDFLRFTFNHKHYRFKVMPFGLNIAPMVWTRVMKAVVKQLRRRGVRMVFYLDDLLIFGKTQQETQQHTQITLQFLISLGFCINWEKSVLIPAQKIEYLELGVDSNTMSMFIPACKLERIKTMAASLAQRSLVSAREVAAFLGQTVACHLATPHQQRRTRALQRCKLALLAQTKNWDQPGKLSWEARKELKWWRTGLNTENGKPIHHPEPTITITTDSSNHSFGGWDSRGHDLQEHWQGSELTLHINQKELLAAKQVTQRLVQEKGQSILVQVDNTVTCSYINKQGGRKPHLSQIAESFWDWAIQRDHTLRSIWIPTSQNVFADQLTRFKIDRTGWRLSHHIFQVVNRRWGPLQVDLFASKQNTQLPLWISRYPAQGALACNAFQQDWTQWLGLYANPPST